MLDEMQETTAKPDPCFHTFQVNNQHFRSDSKH